MEASAAQGQAASADAGESQQGSDQAQQDGQQQDGFDFSQVETRLGEITSGLDELRSFMTERDQAPEGEPQPDEPAELDLSYMDPADPAYDQERAAEQLLSTLGEQQQQQIQQALKPLQDKLEAQTLKSEAAELAQEFPELEDPATADAVFKTAAEWVQSAGLPPESATSYPVVRAVYLMGRALEAHNAEGQQPDTPAASLEGAGGANPGGASTGVTAEDIFGTARTGGLPF